MERGLTEVTEADVSRIKIVDLTDACPPTERTDHWFLVDNKDFAVRTKGEFGTLTTCRPIPNSSACLLTHGIAQLFLLESATHWSPINYYWYTLVVGETYIAAIGVGGTIMFFSDRREEYHYPNPWDVVETILDEDKLTLVFDHGERREFGPAGNETPSSVVDYTQTT